MSLHRAFTAIQDEHHRRVWVGDVIECQCPDRPTFPNATSHARHVADLLVAYLRNNIAQHAEELGMNRRTRNVDYGNDPLPPIRVKQVRFVTDWSCADD